MTHVHRSPSRSRLAVALFALLACGAAQADTYTYSGRLKEFGVPASGRYDLKLAVHADAKLGNTIVTPIEYSGVQVVDGAFKVGFDLPGGYDEAWVELSIRPAGSADWVDLPGRTEAINAPTAIGQCWSTTGDSGVNPATNFIGTTDAQPFVVRTQNAQSLRIEPSSVLFGGVPITTNTIAGSSANTVTAGVRGATISGGGVPNGDSEPNLVDENPNRITDNYGTVGGGYANLAGDDAGFTFDRPFATVGGGQANTASGESSTVGGGEDNTASGAGSTVSGGIENVARGIQSTVGGGAFNCAGGFASWAGGRLAKVRPGTNPFGTGACSGLTYPGGALGDSGTFVWADSQNTNFVSTGDNQFLVRAAGGVAINTNTPAAGAALTVNGSVDIATTGSLSFGSQTRQMLNLWGPAGYGIGVQSDRLYFRSFTGFSWFQGGVHNDAADNAGAGGTLRMRLSNTGQLQTTTGTISTLSDARLKDQVADYTGALDRINSLRPVTYHYRDAGKAAFQPEGTHLGFVAQEVRQVFPQWVSEGDDGYLMLSMRGFEAVVVKAMQELSADNARLRGELEALRADLAALRAIIKPDGVVNETRR